MTTNKYQYQAKRVIVEGHSKIGHFQDAHEYHSILEARFAILLLKNEIRFTPHKKYSVYDEQGKPFTYELDFLLDKPQKFGFMEQFCLGIEVKGVLSYKDWKRLSALTYCHHIPCFIASEPLIQCWEVEGLWKNGDALLYNQKGG